MKKEAQRKMLSEAEANMEMGRYAKAGEVLRGILAESPEDIHVRFMLANCCFMEDRYLEAESICLELVTSYLSVNAFCLLGKIARELKQYSRSEEFFLKSLEIDPQRPSTLAEYSYLLLVCGYKKKAKLVMQEAERIDPNNEAVLHFKFYFQYAHGKKKDEIASIIANFEYSADEVQKLVKAGLSEYKDHRYKKSREYFRQAFLLDPTNKDLLDILNEMDKITHFVFLPNRIFSRLHPVIQFVGMPVIIIGIPLILFALNLSIMGVYVFFGLFGSLLVLNLWSWLSEPIYKYLVKGE